MMLSTLRHLEKEMTAGRPDGDDEDGTGVDSFPAARGDSGGSSDESSWKETTAIVLCASLLRCSSVDAFRGEDAAH